MEWLDRRFEVYQQAVADQRSVTQAAEDIYGEVWEAVSEIVKSAKARGISLQCNGFSPKYVVKMDQWTLTLKLDTDKCGITASISDRDDVPLNLRVCPDGTVCIKHEGTRVSNKEAAKLIMEAFLFKEPSPYAFLFPRA